VYLLGRCHANLSLATTLQCFAAVSDPELLDALAAGCARR
jgi:hypothetical protein